MSSPPTRALPTTADDLLSAGAVAEVAEGAVAPTHVLIVDDDLAGIGLLIDYLREYDFAITTAANGTDGLASARRGLPDLVLLDLVMPDLDGFEVLRALKASPGTRDIPVLLLTARQDTDAKVRGFELGATDYLCKPVAEAELHARITAHLRGRRLLAGLLRRLQSYEARYGSLDDSPSGADPDLPKRDVERLYRARQILRERLADPPQLRELAELLGTNQPRLSRGFRALFGTTVYGFIRETRLQRARQLLIETRWPVKTIAIEVGYRNTADLSRGIKERFGLTPSEVRERL